MERYSAAVVASSAAQNQRPASARRTSQTIAFIGLVPKAAVNHRAVTALMVSSDFAGSSASKKSHTGNMEKFSGLSRFCTRE